MPHLIHCSSKSQPLLQLFLFVLGLTLLLGHSIQAQQLQCDPSTLTKLPLQLSELAVKRDIDTSCPCRGADKGDPGSQLNDANRLQNSIKSNFLASANNPKLLTIGDLIRLQEKVDDKSQSKLPRGDRFTLPSAEQRKQLQDISIGSGKTFSEGDAVTLVGFVIGARHSNLTGGESVNCNNDGCAKNDIHIDVTLSPLDPDESKAEKMNEEGVSVEISPRHRPDAWDLIDSSDYRNYFRTHPVMFTGQLFYDASHSPGGAPDRVTVWEVHPVYAIWVCQNETLMGCPASKKDDKNVWLPFHELKKKLGLQTVRPTKKCKDNP